MKLGSSDISAVKIGSTDVNKVYIGSTEVWSSNSGLLADYPNAAAAYSLRLLQTAYTGDAIQVRRATDNQTQDIGFVDGELDTTSLASFCSGTDGFVTTWYDQSGNGNDATQTTAANQPQIVSSGSVILQNSKPTLDFDGSNDLLSINAMTSFTDVSFFSVIKNDTTNQDSVFLEYALNTPNNFSLGFGNLGTANKIGSRTKINNAVTYIGADFNVGTTQRLVTFLGDSITGTNSEFYLDNTQYTDTIAVRSLGLSSIGARGDNNYNFNGNIQEIIIYTSKQSSNRTGIETNINDFYSIY